MAQAPALEMRNISKEFPGVRALSDVSFSVVPGEIHALCGENGAGKSTLMKTLSGYYRKPAYTGEIVINGQVQDFKSIRESEAAGISIIHQELSLFPDLTIGENIFVGREPTSFGLINWGEVYSRTQTLLKMVGLSLNPREIVRNLGVGQQQLIEIAKALNQKPKVLVLDEPTSALTRGETEKLLNILRKLRAEGVSSILISHKLNEVFDVADRITILRDGKSIATHVANQTTESQVIADMVGRELTDLYPHIERTLGKVVFEVRNVSAANPRVPGKKMLDSINLSVRQHEILGIAGLMGAGRTELLSVIFGAFSGKLTGEFFLEGKKLKISSPSDAIHSGLSLLTEDRKRFGLVLEDSVQKNITLGAISRVSRAGVIRSDTESIEAEKYRKKLQVKTRSLANPVKNLSGGNQQKVVLAKCLMTLPKVLFLDEPTRGVDVGAKAEIYRLIQELAAQGLAVVVVSSELPECMGLCDRILVMNEGAIRGEFLAKDATQEKIMSVATRSQELN